MNRDPCTRAERREQEQRGGLGIPTSQREAASRVPAHATCDSGNGRAWPEGLYSNGSTQFVKMEYKELNEINSLALKMGPCPSEEIEEIDGEVDET